MIQRALDREYPQPKNQLGQPVSAVGGGSPTPYVKDVFPSEGLVVFERLNLLWGADYSIDEGRGAASISNVRRVKTQYVDVNEGDEDEKAAEESLKEVGAKFSEKSPPGWEGTVKRMKKHPEIKNPWALAHWMRGQGYSPGKKK